MSMWAGRWRHELALAARSLGAYKGAPSWPALSSRRPRREVVEAMSDTFIDERGVIQDLLTEPIDAITRIRTVKGAVRGNHVHRRTTQWTYVLSGSLLVASGTTDRIAGPGEMLVDEPGVPHAWKALEDTDCLVFTQGPRSGSEYESDTIRLADPLVV